MVRRVAFRIMPFEPGSRAARARTRRHLGRLVPDLARQAPVMLDLLRRPLLRIGLCHVKAATSVPVAPGFCPSLVLMTRSPAAQVLDYAEHPLWFAGFDPRPLEQLAPTLSPTLPLPAPRDLQRRFLRVLGTNGAIPVRAKRACPRERQGQSVWRLRASTVENTFLENVSMIALAVQDYERRRGFSWVFAARSSRPLTADDLTLDSVLIVPPFDLGISTVTGYFDETALLAHRFVPECGQPLGEHIAAWRPTVQALDPSLLDYPIALVDFNANEFLPEWRRPLDDLGPAEVLDIAYLARHGGASFHTIMTSRTPAALVDCDRRSILTSARIYNMPGRVQKFVAKLSESSLDLAILVPTHFAS